MPKDQLSIFDVYLMYSQSPENANTGKMLTSILVRFLVPAWGGALPKGQRATSKEINAALQFLKKVSLAKIQTLSDDAEEAFDKYGVQNSNKRVFRSILKNFCEWVNSNGFLNSKAESETHIKPQKERVSHGSKKINGKRCRAFHGKKPPQKYALMTHPEDSINLTLLKEIEGFKQFRDAQGCALETINMDLESIKRFLGWLYRYQGVPLEDLRLSSIIDYCPLNISKSDWINERGEPDFQKRFMVLYSKKEHAQNTAKKCIARINNYFEFCKIHPGTCLIRLRAYTALTKFLYRDEVGTDEYMEYDDIPIIKYLKKLTHEFEQKAKVTPPAVEHSKKSIPWEAVLQVLDELRKEADRDFYPCKVRTKSGQIQICNKPRDRGGVARSLMRFLLLGFMTIMPPLRARVYYELELGRTLLLGQHKSGIFIPKGEMSNPEEAQWYLHLLPNDYKTGKTYRERWEVIPNRMFPNGESFYNYIDLWLGTFRDHEKCDHNYFFRGFNDYKKLCATDMRRMVAIFFNHFTGVPVTPKELRKIYVTYLKDSGATEAQLEAAAAFMQHSRKMQSKIYDQQTHSNKIAPIADFNDRVWEKHFSTTN